MHHRNQGPKEIVSSFRLTIGVVERCVSGCFASSLAVVACEVAGCVCSVLRVLIHQHATSVYSQRNVFSVCVCVAQETFSIKLSILLDSVTVF